jgi:hypothetical protein
MTATAVQEQATEWTTAQLKQGIIALFKENDAEVNQVLSEWMTQNINFSMPKKRKHKIYKGDLQIIHSAPFVPFSDMPFWKDHPELQPHDPTPYAIKKEDFNALRAFFKEDGNEVTAEWFNMLD